MGADRGPLAGTQGAGEPMVSWGFRAGARWARIAGERSGQVALPDRLCRERTGSMSDRQVSRPIFGRIVVRVVLAEPEAAAGQPVFQRAYAAEEPLHTVAWDAWSWYRSALEGRGEPALFHGATRVAS